MKYFYRIFNIILIILISISLFIKPEEKRIMTNVVVRGVKVNNHNNSSVQLRINNKNEDNLVRNKVLNLKANFNSNISGASIITDVLETQYGRMSAYGPDCVGCSGHLGGGYDATGGNYYYQDQKYGTVRIVAGDRSYPYGSIVRIKGTSLGEFNAIILDRGGDIGFGRRYMFDLLCSSEAEASNLGSFKNATFEILRYGY